MFRSIGFAAVCVAFATTVFAQENQAGMPMPPGHQMQMQMPMPASANPLGLDSVRDGSGTSWLPDASPMTGVMRDHGPWTFMVHGNAFLEFTKTGTDRGDAAFGSLNWIMAMASRRIGGGQLQLRTMMSLEPLTVGKCGYPLLLQSGELCDGAALHDRQHPHDLFMEVAADYRHAVSDSIAIDIYGAAAGEPALGPTAFPHRLSAMPNPVAPISHHWLDSTHVSFGVVTGGVYGRRWKAESSIFNGREPDDRRFGFDVGRLDSYSGRVWFLPGSAWALQISAGHLAQAEARADGTREDVDRVTASATYHRVIGSRLWATTVAWGRNKEGGRATSALLAETTVDVTAHDTFFARADVVGKTAADLVVSLADDRTFTVSKFQAGYTRWLGHAHGIETGAGASVGASVIPSALQPFYGSRVGAEAMVYVTARVR